MKSTDIQYKSRTDSRNTRVRLASTLVTKKSPSTYTHSGNAELEKNRTNEKNTKIENTKNEKNTIEWQGTKMDSVCFGKLVIGGLIATAL